MIHTTSFNLSRGRWYPTGTLNYSLDAVAQDEGLKTRLLEDVRWFLESEAWHLDKGLVYSRSKFDIGREGIPSY